MNNEGRLKVKHLIEENYTTNISEDEQKESKGELIISQTSGHISVIGKSDVVSATKDIEGRLSSVFEIANTARYALEQLNYFTMKNKYSSLNCDPELKDSIYGEWRLPVKYTFDSFRGMTSARKWSCEDILTDINYKYNLILKIEEIEKTLESELNRYNREMYAYRNKVDKQSIDILELEDLYETIVKEIGELESLKVETAILKEVLDYHHQILSQRVYDIEYKVDQLDNKFKGGYGDISDESTRYAGILDKIFSKSLVESEDGTYKYVYNDNSLVFKDEYDEFIEKCIGAMLANQDKIDFKHYNE